MSDDDGLFREIKEDVRREELMNMWNKYGIYIMGAIAAIILSVTGYKLSNYWSQQASERGAAHLLKAESLSEEKKTAEAMELYKKLTESGPDGYAALSKMRIAALEAASGKQDKAIAQFSDIAKGGKIDPIFSDFAIIQTAMLTVDKGIPADILKKLKALSTGSSSWRYNAVEILALSEYKAKKYKEASTLYAQIVGDVKAPRGLKARSEMMIRTISTTVSEQEAAQKTQAPATDPKKKK